MKTEKQKMLAGELYDALDPELVEARERARDLCHDLNASREREQDVDDCMQPETTSSLMTRRS